ncbi:MAG: hypothetical protein MJK15_00480 [Colwellia sp.]|nr:hypothetical protein [Colwellia sp.]
MNRNNILSVPNPVSYKENVLKKVGYIIALSRYIRQEKGINLTTQYSEMLFLYIVKQLGPILYFEARLWRRTFSLTEKMRFLNTSQYKKRINELNPPTYRKFSNDKLVEKSILSLLGVPTAKFLGFLHPFNGSDSKAQPLTTPEQLTEFLRQYIDKKLCFKLTEGWGGDGFVAAKVLAVNGELFLCSLKAGAKPQPINDFFRQYLAKNYHDGLVIEAFIEQHAVLSQLNESSVNTLRMWLIQSQGKVKVIGAVLRIGRKDQLVDNCGQGGFVCLIDKDSGKIKHGMTPSVIPRPFDQHPDTQVQLTGIQLPYWDKCLKIGQSCLRVFPHTNFVGLDIAFSKDGPLIVELNQEPDKISARIFGLPLKDLLDNDSF